MAEPKQKLSKIRSKNRRRNQVKLMLKKQLATCAYCKKPVAKHRIHRHCVEAAVTK